LEAQELREQLAKVQEANKEQADLAAAEIVAQPPATQPNDDVVVGLVNNASIMPI
jgi:hypothetical protein